MNLEFYQQIFEKYSDVKYHDNPSSGSRIVPSEQTDMTKPIADFRNFANALKILLINYWNNNGVNFNRSARLKASSVMTLSP